MVDRTRKSGLVLATMALLLLATAGKALADDEPAGMGITGGLSMGDLAGSDAPSDSSWRTGLAVGGFVYAYTSPQSAVQMDLLYVQKGASWSQPRQVAGGSENADLTMSLSYLELPLLWRTADYLFGSEVAAVLVFGAYASYNLGSTLTIDYATSKDEENELSDIAAFDFGLILGVALEYSAFVVEARYDWGLVTIDSRDYMDEFRMQTRTLMIMGGLRTF